MKPIFQKPKTSRAKTKDATRVRPALADLWSSILPWKREVFVGLFLFLSISLLSAAIPYIYGRVTDLIIEDRNFKLAISLLFIWLFISFIKNLFSYRADIILEKVSIGASNFYILKSFGHVLTLPLSFHKEKKMGSVSRRIIDAGDRAIYTIIDSVLFDFLPSVILFTASLFILFFVEWRLSLILLLGSFLYVFVTIFFTRSIIKTQKKVRKSWERAYGFFFDALNNIHNIKITSNEEYEKKRVSHSFNSAFQKDVAFRRLWYKMNSFQSAIFDLSFVAVFAFGSFLLAGGLLSPGELIMFIGYTSLLTSPLSRLAQQYRSFRQSVLDINRAREFLNLKSEALSGSKKLKILENIEFKNVSFAYSQNKNLVLKNISFTVVSGETIALVGKSGVGKTTLLDLLGRYYETKIGQVLINGEDVKSINLKSLRDQIAVVPQEVSLFNDTIIQNIRYARPKATDDEVIAAAHAANADGFIQKFPKKYKQRVGERGIKLSTGQKQRIAIARALLRDPSILILDEATSALDSESELLVKEAIDRLIKNRTTFIIAHRLSTIKNADRIIVLEKGHIAEMGTHRELMKKENGIYRHLFELQSARHSA